MKRLGALVAALVLIGISGQARAIPVTVQFTALLTDRWAFPNNAPGDQSLTNAGGTVSGSFSYDTASSPTSITIVNGGSQTDYTFAASLLSFDINGTYDFQTTTVSISTTHGNPNWDTFVVAGSGNAVSTYPLPSSLSFTLSLPAPPHTTNFSTLPSYLDYSMFMPTSSVEDPGVQITGSDGTLLSYDVTTLDTVPLPGTILLLTPGFVGLAALRKRLKK
ncbi:MAG TPA: hypothetical protein VLX12_02315 [Syntrophorhabdales bacterium]|nr:hypothetical protein [Syntrophorhabdales bacterium]